jgi:hypothetical protein
LAEAMGYEVYELGLPDVKVYKDGPEVWKRHCYDWSPTTDIQDALEVFIYFKLDELYRSLNIWVAMRYENSTLPMVNAESDESAAKAISLAAIQDIERSKSDE